jgi:hypothetical protein
MLSPSGLNSSFSPVICTKAINTYLDYERKQEAAAAAEAAAVAAASSSNAVVVAADSTPATAVAAVKP